MNNVNIIKSVLTTEELKAFRAECDSHRNTLKETDLSEYGASIDIFENSHLKESDKARYDPVSYFNERWRDRRPSESDALSIKSALLQKLPAIICKIKECNQLNIFNESYIVKEPSSQIAFRWHVDSDEQLGAVPECNRSVYYSAWCPLDDSDINNGTLSFPIGTNVINLVLDDGTVPDVSFNKADSIRLKSKVKNNAVRNEDKVDDNIVRKEVVIERVDHIKLLEPSKDDDGVAVEVEAGSIVLFSSSMWHRSGINLSKLARRVLYVQYSPDVIISGANVQRVQNITTSCENIQYIPNSEGIVQLIETNSDNISSSSSSSSSSRSIDSKNRNSDISSSNKRLNLDNEQWPLCFAVKCSPEEVIINLSKDSKDKNSAVCDKDKVENIAYNENSNEDSLIRKKIKI